MFSLATDHFFSATNFRTIANQMPAAMLIATAMTYMLVIAEIDLSVGSVLGFCSAVMGVALTQWHWPLAAALAATLGGGAAVRRFQRAGLTALAAALIHRHPRACWRWPAAARTP